MEKKMEQLVKQIGKVLLGKEEVVKKVVIALMCEGHVLIEDVPGVGKTSLVAALAQSVAADFKRIQFTPDIVPSDVTGFSLYNPKTGDFEYRPGAIVSQFVLADEINRTSPKTQASLLEAMEEGQVTVDGHTYSLPRPFMVLATQNPVEYLGTFPLPEAQMDRFFMKLTLGYPDEVYEKEMLVKFKEVHPLKTLKPIIQTDEIIKIQQQVREVYIEESLNSLIIEIIKETRRHPEVVLGASPRGSLNLLRAAQGHAFYEGRSYVTPDDIMKMAPFVLAHRLQLKQEAKLKKVTGEQVIQSILKQVRIPKVKYYEEK